jgi:hypothetical protein
MPRVVRPRADQRGVSFEHHARAGEHPFRTTAMPTLTLKFKDQIKREFVLAPGG